MVYSEQDLKDAIQKYHRGGHSIRSISREFAILYTTLSDRLYGTQTYQEASETQQTLSQV
jgi:transposase-like protein